MDKRNLNKSRLAEICKFSTPKINGIVTRSRSFTKLFLILTYFFFSISTLYSIDVDPIGKNVKEGVNRYKAQDFQGSLESFNQAEMQGKEDDRLFFNKGTSYYKLNDYKLALKYFEKSALSEDKDLKLRSLYNKGNTYSKLGDKKNAIKSYMDALNTDPEFLPARKNLELLTKKDSKDKQDKKKEEQEDKDENPEKDEKKGNQKDKKDTSGNEKKNSQGNQKQESENKGEEKIKESNNKITKEEAERILESAKQNKINRKKMTQKQPERNEVFW